MVPMVPMLFRSVGRNKGVRCSAPSTCGFLPRQNEPGDPGAYTDRMAQAFVWTDVMASGLLTIGQHIELQWHLN